jgi:hypothetical protein
VRLLATEESSPTDVESALDVERLPRILLAIMAGSNDETLIERVCGSVTRLMDVSGSGISVIADGEYKATLCEMGDHGHAEELQFMLGEGPCLTAHESGEPVLAPDLAGEARWPAFSEAAAAGGVRAVFGFPLQLGAARLGTLSLFRNRPGDLDDDEYHDALVVADLAMRVVLQMQADGPTNDLPAIPAPASTWRWEVHQATGMIAAQTGVPMEEALVRLRARAYSEARSMHDVAVDVVSRKLRFGARE